MTDTATITEVPLDTLPLDRFDSLIGSEPLKGLQAAAARAAALMDGRTWWNLNSTAKGGGVAEMLASLLPYARGAGIDTRWLVIDAEDDFFTVSKRIHNQLHGNHGDGQGLGENDRAVYEHAMAYNAPDLSPLIQPGDVVLFHDPQTAGLIEIAQAAGAATAWRCHVGADEPNDLARAAWEFLRPYVSAADRCVFTCKKHVWEWLADEGVVIMPPSIDAFTAKNQELPDPIANAILCAAGIIDGNGSNGARPEYVNRHGETCVVGRRATMSSGPIPDGPPLVVQVSRWDGLKDPVGVVRGFAEHVVSESDAHLVLAGPATDAVDDDPEGAETFDDVTAAWEALPSDIKSRVHLVSLPMDDEDENAATVNALQHRAAVVVQKSLAEGFGLTVAEAMWKRRPVVASARGGITEQITDDETGVLVHDPEDLAEFASALRDVLADPVRAKRLGKAAHERVCETFLAPRELLQHFELLEQLLAG